MSSQSWGGEFFSYPFPQGYYYQHHNWFGLFITSLVSLRKEVGKIDSLKINVKVLRAGKKANDQQLIGT